MARCDLTGLSPRSFERLVQALAAKVIGPGVMVFGDGPDGGREATYEGKMPYPSTEAPWDGYCVLQAKFLERPRDSKSDGDWAIKQLREELKKYADRKKQRRMPQYYIFATNVALTPVAKKGSKDRLASEFAKYRDPVPIRAYGIWDRDQIETFLDCHEDVRRAYAAWITPGDVLSEVLTWFKASRPDFGEVMANFLAKELRADQYARLEQAGHTADERIRLAPVFVDLRVCDERLSEPPADKEDGDSEVGFAMQLIAAARERFDPESVQEDRLGAKRLRRPPGKPEPGRFVLIGGPGQGKTTIGQFICQLLRAALLKDQPRARLAVEDRTALDAIVGVCATEDLELPKARRFPLRIVLNELAAVLSKAPRKDKPTLLSYLAAHISRTTGRDVSTADFRAWLKTYPWLVVFDGLDEVPVSSNRTEVLKAIEDFWTDAAQCNADVLVIATTRPQGYSEDFSPTYYRHVWLVPLSPKQALHYAERLAQAKFGDNEAERRRVLSGLETAAGHEATARLMRSPLQVTIMHTLVEHGGTPPQDRWQLFHDYYETIYRREKQRPVPAAPILQDRKPEIDCIHGRVALLLQVQCERAVGSEDKLSTPQFERIVEDLLEEEGFQSPRREELKQGLLDAAGHRLVFLAELEQGQVGFEIPSLREFMAAEALFDGGDEVVVRRLREIAPVASWRNVFSLAAGRCFAKRQHQHLRDSIHSICVDLNHELGGPVGAAIRAGSLLAMDLLEDGLDRRSPKYGRLLALTALELMELPPSEVNQRLASLCRDELEKVFEEQIEQRMGRAEHAERLGAWATLLPLVAGNRAWADDVAERHWPSGAENQLEVVELAAARAPEAWLCPRLIDLLPRVEPQRWHALARRRTPLSSFADEGPPWYKAALEFVREPFGRTRRRMEASLRLRGGRSRSPLRWLFGPVSCAGTNGLGAARDVPRHHDGWLPLREAARFVRSPSKQSLGQSLRRTARGDATGARGFHLSGLPWPLAACVASSESAPELDDLAQRALSGGLGDAADWLKAEERWAQNGITREDILYMNDDRWPFDQHIAARGFPFAVDHWSVAHDSPEREELLLELFRIREGLPPSRMRSKLAGFMCFVLTTGVDTSVLSGQIRLADLRGVLDEASDAWVDLDFIEATCCLARSEAELLAFLDEVTSRQRLAPYGELSEDNLARLARALRQQPGRTGALRLLGVLTARGARVTVDPASVDAREFQEARLRQAAIVVRLAQGSFDHAEAEDLATITAEAYAQEPAAVAAGVSTISEHDLSGPEVDAYLLALLRALPDQAVRDKGRIVGRLKDLFRRRETELDDLARWKELSFPAELLPGS